MIRIGRIGNFVLRAAGALKDGAGMAVRHPSTFLAPVAIMGPACSGGALTATQDSQFTDALKAGIDLDPINFSISTQAASYKTVVLDIKIDVIKGIGEGVQNLELYLTLTSEGAVYANSILPGELVGYEGEVDGNTFASGADFTPQPIGPDMPAIIPLPRDFNKGGVVKRGIVKAKVRFSTGEAYPEKEYSGNVFPTLYGIEAGSPFYVPGEDVYEGDITEDSAGIDAAPDSSNDTMTDGADVASEAESES